MRVRFKNAALQKMYEDARRAYSMHSASLFGRDNKPRRGDGISSAFWNGYDGQPSRYLRTSLAYASWAAGRDAEKAGR